MTTNGELPAGGGGAAFWAALGVRIEPEPEPESESESDTDTDTDTDTDADADADADADTESHTDSEPETAHEDVADAPPNESTSPDVDIPAQPEPIADHDRQDPIIIPAQIQPQPQEQPSPDEVQVPVQAQSSLDEVEPQEGEVVDGLAVLSESLAESRRAREDELANMPGAEPAWQLAGDLSGPLPPLKTCLEAILMVVDEPVTDVVLAQVVERPKGEVAAALRELAAEYNEQGRGFELREVGIGDGHGTATGWRMYSRVECAPVVERFVRDGQQAKLTQAALETLAVVAYRQPVSRSKVSAIRGVNCDGVMRTLLARGLVEECGTEHETGALLYQTTGYFLERMGLKGLDELPELAPLLPSAADVEEEA